MTPRSIPRLVLALLLCTAAWAAENDFKEIESHVTEFTLANGWKFLVLERHQAPVAAFLTYADVGSAQEVTGITGLAHMFEHMAFKGSRNVGAKNYAEERLALARVDAAYAALSAEKRKGRSADAGKIKQLEESWKKAQEEAGKYVVPNEFGEAVERAGGQGLNAFTREDSTEYFFSLPSNEMELWFYLESERFGDPVFREFYKERSVVQEERRLGQSQPIGRLVEEFQATAYKAHPYHEPTIGHMSDLDSFSREDAAAFFKKYYTPSNLTSVVVGDISPKQVRQMAGKYLGVIPSSPKPDPIHTVEPPQTGERRVTLRLQSQRFFVAGYHKPDINDPDNAVYNALGSVLSDGRSSRLYRSLVRDKKIATQVGGFPGFPGQKYPGLFLFFAMASPGHTNQEIEKAIDEEIEKLEKEPVSQDDLDGVKRRARANLLRSLDDNSNLALQLSDYQVLTGDWRNLFRDLDKINAVTPGDIQRIAKATFTFDNKTVGVIEPLETAAK